MAPPLARTSCALFKNLLSRGPSPLAKAFPRALELSSWAHNEGSQRHPLPCLCAVRRAFTTGTPPRYQMAEAEEVPEGGTVGDLNRSQAELCQDVEKVDESDFDPKIVEICNKVMELNTIEIIMMMHVIDHRTGGLLTKDIAEWNLGRPGGAPAAGGGGEGGVEGAEEGAPAQAKDAFELKVTGFDASAKIKVIKEVRSICGLGLKEAKEVVESLPKVIKKDLKKEEAEELLEKLKAVGAEVELV